jgi:inner membrane protein
MDNITHSLVGLGVGELLQRSLPAEDNPARQQTRHRLLLTACAAASNFPDLDLVLTHLLAPPIGYLLHHRGFTHTLLLLPPQALLLLAAMWLLWPNARTLLRSSRTARYGLALAMACGLLLHLAMDFMNSYGVHPFYPFDGRWFYGDMVYIVEPVFWVAFGVPLALAVPLRPARWVLLLGLFSLLVFVAAHGFLSWSSFGALLALGVLTAALRLWQHQSRRALALALLVSLGFVGAQSVASSQARQQARLALQALDPQARVLDVALTAFPSQPLCWAFASVQSDEAAGTYRLRRGVLRIGHDGSTVAACPPALRGNVPGAGELALESDWQGSLAALRTLAANDCHLANWLRFARVPAVDALQASDLRFATTPRGNFSTLNLAAGAGQACPANVPRWGMPRADLLSGPRPAP